MTSLEALLKKLRLEEHIQTHIRHKKAAHGNYYHPESDLMLDEMLEEYRECLRMLVAP